jgi:hypothetical protein
MQSNVWIADTQQVPSRQSCNHSRECQEEFVFHDILLAFKAKKKRPKKNKTMTRTRPKAIKETTGITNDALLELRHGVIMPRNKTKGAQR